jgi:hypothetical protein
MGDIHALPSTLIIIPSLSFYSIPFFYVIVTFYIFSKGVTTLNERLVSESTTSSTLCDAFIISETTTYLTPIAHFSHLQRFAAPFTLVK